MSCNAAPFALPMWLDGHSFLNIPDVLIDVFRPSDGGLRLRLPRCGSAEMHLALDAARRAVGAWYLDDVERRRLLVSLGELLSQFAGEIAALLLLESDASEAVVRADVAAAVDVLKTVPVHNQSQGIVVLRDDGNAPYATRVAALATAWAGGGALVVVNDAIAPSALFVLAELSAVAGFPAGVFSLLYGDADVVTAMRLMAV